MSDQPILDSSFLFINDVTIPWPDLLKILVFGEWLPLLLEPRRKFSIRLNNNSYEIIENNEHKIPLFTKEKDIHTRQLPVVFAHPLADYMPIVGSPAPSKSPTKKEQALVGICCAPQYALVSRIMKYYDNSKIRPYEYSTKTEAEKKLQTPQYKKTLAELLDPAERDANADDNIIIARLPLCIPDPGTGLPMHEYQLLIFVDSLEARLLSQLRKLDLECVWEKEFQHSCSIQISFYQSQTLYSIEEQAQDLSCNPNHKYVILINSIKNAIPSSITTRQISDLLHLALQNFSPTTLKSFVMKIQQYKRVVDITRYESAIIFSKLFCVAPLELKNIDLQSFYAMMQQPEDPGNIFRYLGEETQCNLVYNLGTRLRIIASPKKDQTPRNNQWLIWITAANLITTLQSLPKENRALLFSKLCTLENYPMLHKNSLHLLAHEKEQLKRLLLSLDELAQEEGSSPLTSTACMLDDPCAIVEPAPPILSSTAKIPTKPIISISSFEKLLKEEGHKMLDLTLHLGDFFHRPSPP